MEESKSILEQIIATQQVSHRDNFHPRATLEKLLGLLAEREREVLLRRFGLGASQAETLESIGRTLQVTRERVRQIERLAITKLRESSQAKAILHPLQQVVVELLEADGGAATDARVLAELQESGDTVAPAVLSFYLAEVLADVVAPLGGAGMRYVPGWRLRSASLEVLDVLVARAREIIEVRGVPIKGDEFALQLVREQLTGPLGQPLLEARLVLSLLELSSEIRQNPFGEWGLRHWETISPRRMNDKIYLVMKKHAQPLHFREIVRLINEQGFDHKQAHAPTVHNELILDPKFVLIGRGIYALHEWGYEPGVVADVIATVLQRRGPLTRDEVVAEVMAQRIVKRGTVALALTNKQRFRRLPDGRYANFEVVQPSA